MAHFAKLDENNYVLDVLVVNNENIDSENEEASGIAYLTDLFGGIWKQTSYNKTFRHNYAQPGGYYDNEQNAFIPPKFEECPSFILDDTFQWVPPTPYPIDGEIYRWDESIVSWIQDSTYTPTITS